MTINTGNYSAVNPGNPVAVDQGPQRLPSNWLSPYDGAQHLNVNVVETWLDSDLLDIGWYPTNIVDPTYDPIIQYLGAYQFTIFSTYVDAEREVLDKSQEQIDQEKDTTIADSQRVATDLAVQTENILRQNTQRGDVGSAPIIPAEDVADTEIYLASLYDAMDDDTEPVEDPPGTIRQVVTVPGENRDRMVITRYLDTWNTPDDVNGIDGTLYAQDADGMSLKVHDAAGTYLWTQPFELVSDGVWKTPSHSSYWFHEGKVDLYYVIFKGQDISQKRGMAAVTEEQVFDVRWSGDAAATVGHG